jgi:diguanylate cyclase (GGDEF)-like protein
MGRQLLIIESTGCPDSRIRQHGFKQADIPIGGNTVKILIADDDDVSRRVLQATLTKWGYDVVIATNGLEAWQLLRETNAPQLAILDWVMPGMDGVEVCREIRRREEEPYVYMLLLTAKSRKRDIIAGLRAGADDYLAKPFDPQELKARLRTGRRILELQAQLVATRESLRHQATHDSLTSLLNRGAILDMLRNELDTNNRRGLPLSIVMADLDHFKQVNDTYGHIVGDAILHEAARRMKASVRAYDSIGRYGGEEFLFILPGCNGSDASGQAQRLQKCITEDPVDLPRFSISFTLSLGVVSTSTPRVEDVDRLIQAADEALYEAKAQGRNRVVLGKIPQPAPEKPVPYDSVPAPGEDSLLM